jgi:lipoprotein-anchoring transpeptidase ErfK/SrfK
MHTRINVQDSLHRRDFLKLWGVSLGSFIPGSIREWLPEEEDLEPLGIGRVTISSIGLFQEPDFASPRLRWIGRDKLVSIIKEFDSPFGPVRNPHWYRLVGGYAHSAYIQRVEAAQLNPPAAMIPEGGQLGEVTVPYTQSMRKVSPDLWQPAYRLYFGSLFWITDFITGPDGNTWYELTDDRLRVNYCAPTSHIRPVPRADTTPISPHIPEAEKRIVISIADQTLQAYESSQLVFQTSISSGLHSRGPSPNGIPTDTPQGNFHISRKTPSRHMGDGILTSDLEAYELPGVPWVSFFHEYGIGTHGTYWHNNFGSRMSHGCVNMRNEDAKWLYRWTTPRIRHSEWYKLGRGTLVQVV